MVCSSAGDQSQPAATPSDVGGAIVAWYDGRNPDNINIYAQRLDASGTIQWPSGGVPVCAASGSQTNALVVPDGSGGALVIWSDLRATSSDLYAQRMSSSGLPQWALDGVVVCDEPHQQSSALLVADGSGGAMVGWIDQRPGDGDEYESDVYAQRLDALGTREWAPQ